jgi:hypothetical protein
VHTIDLIVPLTSRKRRRFIGGGMRLTDAEAAAANRRRSTATLTATATFTAAPRQPPESEAAWLTVIYQVPAKPEKQTVEDQRQGAVTVANAVAKRMDKARPMRTAVECPSSARPRLDGPGRGAHSYGSDRHLAGARPGAIRADDLPVTFPPSSSSEVRSWLR